MICGLLCRSPDWRSTCVLTYLPRQDPTRLYAALQSGLLLMIAAGSVTANEVLKPGLPAFMSR